MVLLKVGRDAAGLTKKVSLGFLIYEETPEGRGEKVMHSLLYYINVLSKTLTQTETAFAS